MVQENPKTFLKEIEHVWASDKKYLLETIAENEKKISARPQGDTQAVFYSVANFIYTDIIIQREMNIYLLKLLVKLDDRIRKLERKSGITEERFLIDKELLKHFRNLQKEKERMEMAGKEMFG